VEALGLIASNAAIEVLLTASHDENKSVRTAVLTALAASLTFFLLNTESDGLSALEPKNLNRAIESFLLGLEDSDCEVRVSAAKAFMSVRDERAIPPLEVALSDSNEEVRANAATALAVAGAMRSIGPLLSVLTDEIADVRALAAFSLGQIRSTEAIEPVCKALRDKDVVVRRYAVKALGIFGSKSAIEPLTQALHDDDYKVRGFAAEALGEIGDESASDSLREMLSDREVLVREYAIESLGKICGDRALEDLSLALHDESGHVRSRATEQLAAIGSQQSTKAVDLLGTALLDPDMNVNDRAAKALGAISSQQAIKILTDALENERHDTRWNSIQALAQKKTNPIVKAIFRVVCDPASDLRGYSAWYLSLCDEVELQTAIINCWNDPKAFVRKKVAELTGYYCDDPHTSLLLAELAKTDSDGAVRDAAKFASEQLARKLELLGRVVSEGTASTITDNESSELFLVGEAFKVVAEAGHIFRPTSNSDWGIDGEIEFKDEKGHASGKRVYLQLKSGDSHRHKRKSDSKEIFTIKNPRHVEYWQSHAYPVFLVIRDSAGRIRWMNITDYLRWHGAGIRQIEFEGEPFNADGINKMRIAMKEFDRL
jgi:HEAT repeat protein